ncbi:CopD family protein [Mycolicibacterium sp. ELW1]|uniref:CopD family protein n=1 Tax=Mycobacteriaceae TaxID=1762 RepID=UPI0011EE255D|nr:CopD family protein [Mycobacterium sp. ELW1]QEN12209.1 CopD family protein [Mycobacterium sp. ELW1]
MPGPTPPAPAALDVVTQVVYYLSLSIPLGMGLTVGALAIPESRGGLIARQVRSLAVPAAIVVLLGVVLQFRAAAHLSVMTLAPLFALMLAACGLVAMRWSQSRTLPLGVAVVAAVAAVIPEIPVTFANLSRVVSNVLTAVHVLGATTWVGGLVVLGATGIAVRRNMTRGDEGVAADWAQIWERFSLVAMIAVGALVVSGSWLAWTHVGTPGQLLTTAYGRALAVKLVLVVVLLCAGAYNVRVLLPRIRALQSDGDTRGLFHLAAQHFPAVVFAEALVAICVLTVVPFLRGSARAQAGSPAAVSFDLGTFGVGAVLIAAVAAAMWAGSRRSVKPLAPSTPVP